MPATVSHLRKFHRIRPNLQSHLDLSKLKELPETYDWTQLDQHSTSSRDPKVLLQPTVPVIDLAAPNVEKLIGDSCKDWGVFQIVNHGVPTTLLDAIESANRSLFSLPLQRKLKAAREPDGVSGYGSARISTFFAKHMWYEGFTISGSPVDHARQLWPNSYTKFCDIIEEYSGEMKQLAGKLMCLMLASLGITKEDVEWAGPQGQFEGAHAALQLNYYPRCPEPSRAMGLAAHTDSTLLTILHQNNTRGLEVYHEGDGWISVPPMQDALTINIGDLFHILSNGLYRNVLHRAVVNGTSNRLSVAYLYGPPDGVLISPSKKILDTGCPALYKAVSWKEYLGIKAQVFEKALSLVRLCTPVNPVDDVKEG